MGRKRLYPEGHDGAPILSVRMPPELLAWAKEKGGAPWVRSLVEREREASRASCDSQK